MITTDASIHSYPEGDSSIGRMALTAREFGFDSLVAIDGKEDEIFDVRILRGVVLASERIQDIIGQIRKERQGNAIILVNAGDYSFNRSLLHVKGLHIIRHIHKTHKKSFDHIMARMAAERSIAIDIDLHPVIYLRGSPRQKVLQRYCELVRLQSRFEFPMTLSSNAFSILEQKTARDMEMICSLFGMEGGQVKEALATIGKICSPRRPVQVVE